MTVVKTGLKAGDLVIVRGQDGLPDGAAIAVEQMNPARLATRHSRAVLLLTLLLAVAGAIASVSLPSSIYPPLRVPAHRRHRARRARTPARSMTLTVARPIEQAIMEVPGIRRVRSRTFRGATEISAQFEPATDMVVALQQVQNRVAEIRGDAAGRHRARRSTG